MTITERNLNPTQFRARLSEYLSGGACDTFCGIYANLYNDAAVYAQEDDELRECKEEIEDLREALAQAQLDLAEARAEVALFVANPDNAPEKPKKKKRGKTG